MTVLNAPQQRFGLLSETGEVLTVFVAQEELQRLQLEHQQLREELTKTQQELANLKQAKEAVEAERDGYLQSLHHLLREDFTITDEELADFRTNGIPARDVLREIEEMLRGDERNGHGA